MSKHIAHELSEDKKAIELAAYRLGPWNDANEFMARIATGNAPQHRAESKYPHIVWPES